MSNDYVERVRERAHQIWIREGRPEGKHREHWLQAEQELAHEGHGDKAQDEAGRAAALDYDRKAIEFSERGEVDGKAREAEESLAGREAEELNKAEAAGKSRSKAKNSVGNL